MEFNSVSFILALIAILIFIVVLVLLFRGNKSLSRYAVVHIETECIETGISTSDYKIYNGTNGLYLGTAPMDLSLSRKSNKEKPTLSLIVRQNEDGSPTYWKIIIVDNWANTPLEAMDAYKKNEVLFHVKCN